MNIKIEKITNPYFISAFSKLCRVNLEVDQLAMARCLNAIDAEQKNFRTALTNIQSKYCVEKDGNLTIIPDKNKVFNEEIEKLNASEVPFPLPEITLAAKVKTEKQESFTAMDIYVLEGVVIWK